jgi:endonuclease/exonuclease/phosphatase family metal-dependent hydrolase
MFFTLAEQPAHMMNRRLHRTLGHIFKRIALLAAPLACLFLAIETVGWASRRPVPLLVEHRPVTAPPGKSDRELNLKLVTYNIWGLPSWMTGARPGRYPRIAGELERLDPDFVLLQEAWTDEARKSAPAQGPWSIARAAGQHMFVQQSGLVTLSRFPIIGGRFYPFSRAAFPDCFVNKGVLKVTVRLSSGQVLNVWNVHLQDGGTPELMLSQIRELESHVQAAQDGQIADLVGGDFNCTPESRSFRELVNGLGPSVQQLGGTEPFVTWDGMSGKHGAGETLDHIFIKKRATFQNVKAIQRVAFAAESLEQRLSDHFGIEAMVTLSGTPSLAQPLGMLLGTARLPVVTAAQGMY